MKSDGESTKMTEVSQNPVRRKLKVLVFGFDVAEVSQIRRIRAMASLGHDVHSFTMRRNNMNAEFKPDWPNTHLYETENENLKKRVAVIAGSIVKMTGHRDRVRDADLIFARNLDMLAIAWAARMMAGAGEVPLVYECLDINGALTGDGLKAKTMRVAERRLLAGVQMLIVSSPGFIREYFEPWQGYQGQWVLLENKLAAGAALPERPISREVTGGTLKLGWVGTIRCAPSLELLARLAALMGDRIEVHIHGVVHRHVLPDFDAILDAQPNMIFHGPYDYPADLASIYTGVDLVWAQDLWQAGSNSDWLLPNRIYEASWAGCPSIAVAGTETGRRVKDNRLGWVIERADADDLQKLLETLTSTEIARCGQTLLDRSSSEFVQSPDEIAAIINQVQEATQ